MPLAILNTPALLNGQPSGLVPLRILVSLLGVIGRLTLFGGKIIDRP